MFFGYDQQFPFEFGVIPPDGGAVITMFVLFSLPFHRKGKEVMHRIKQSFTFYFFFLEFS